MKFEKMADKCPWRTLFGVCVANKNECCERNCAVWFFMTMDIEERYTNALVDMGYERENEKGDK